MNLLSKTVFFDLPMKIKKHLLDNANCKYQYKNTDNSERSYSKSCSRASGEISVRYKKTSLQEVTF